MSIKATISILTYNGEDHLKNIIKAISRQKVNFEYEVLIIDSGSTDKTLSIIKLAQEKYRNISIRLHQIPNSEFGHGKTRNLVAEMAKGEFVIYITHDAVPSHNRWLYEMIAPFKISDKIVGVLGKQIPQPKSIPLLKYEIQSVFNNFGPDFGTTIFYKDKFIKKKSIYDSVSFYSDANSAVRRDYLLANPYKDVAYAEDQLFGREIIDNGYYKAYAARGSVKHSNDLKLSEYNKRMFDETVGLRKNGIGVEVISLKRVVKLITLGIIKDTIRILRDKEYSLKRKLYWMVLNPFFVIEKWRGVRRATLVDTSDKETIEKHSLEHNKKK